ncbi:myosin-2 heavy chain-like [Ylistrum balloti]|uniref:myosin-2 heavy chain-like n=1 Tax=Ylistrum balloti TaxID=509963 RepID=UPI00290598B6|nr:myosin-2 heavy chain-like [Ylistrum balloti]
MELEVDEASKSLVASWFSDESFDTEPEDNPSKKKKNKKKEKVEKTEPPITKQKLSNGIKKSPSSSQSSNNISSTSSFVEEKLKKKLKKSKHMKDKEKKETEKKFTGMKKLSTADSSDDEEESKTSLVGQKSPNKILVQRHTVESLQQKLEDNALSKTAKKKLKKKLNALLSNQEEDSKAVKHSENINSETKKVEKKKKVKVEESKTESKIANGDDIERNSIKGEEGKGDKDKKKTKKEKKLMKKQKAELISDEAQDSGENKKLKPKKRQKEASSSEESDDDGPMVHKKPKMKVSENSGTPDRSKHSIVTLRQKLQITTSQSTRKNIRKKIAELEAKQQSQSAAKTNSNGMSSDSSESEHSSDVMEKTNVVKSPVKESLIDKLKKMKSPCLEKSVKSSPITPASSKKRSAQEAKIENGSPPKLKKKSKVQAEVGDTTLNPEKSVEERLHHYNQRLQEEGLSAASRKRIRRQISKLKEGSGKEVKTTTMTAKAVDSTTSKTKKEDSTKTKSKKKQKKLTETSLEPNSKIRDSTIEAAGMKTEGSTKKMKVKKAVSLEMGEKKLAKKKRKDSDEDLWKATEGWESDENSADDIVSEETPKQKKKAEDGHIRKRLKKRSKQKNIKKDNRPDHLKPPHLRLAKEGQEDSA